MLRSGGYLALETAGGEQAHGVAAFLVSYPGRPASVMVGDVASITPFEKTADYSQSDACAYNPDSAFRDVEVVRDCYGIERFVTAYRT